MDTDSSILKIDKYVRVKHAVFEKKYFSQLWQFL